MRRSGGGRDCILLGPARDGKRTTLLKADRLNVTTKDFVEARCKTNARIVRKVTPEDWHLRVGVGRESTEHGGIRERLLRNTGMQHPNLRPR